MWPLGKCIFPQHQTVVICCFVKTVGSEFGCLNFKDDGPFQPFHKNGMLMKLVNGFVDCFCYAVT